MTLCYEYIHGKGVKIHDEGHNFINGKCIRCELEESYMKPPKQEKRSSDDYEKVNTEDFSYGCIEEIEYDLEHEFKYEGKVTKKAGVRFKFKLEGYEYPHYSQWMTFSYGEKTNLYQRYIKPNIDQPSPNMDFDLDEMKSWRVKTFWKTTTSGFQFPEIVRKVRAPDEEHIETEEPPF